MVDLEGIPSQYRERSHEMGMSEVLWYGLYSAICQIAWDLYQLESAAIVSKQSERYFRQRHSQQRRVQVRKLKQANVPKTTGEVQALRGRFQCLGTAVKGLSFLLIS
jgi:hypothetical protein